MILETHSCRQKQALRLDFSLLVFVASWTPVLSGPRLLRDGIKTNTNSSLFWTCAAIGFHAKWVQSVKGNQLLHKPQMETSLSMLTCTSAILLECQAEIFVHLKDIFWFVCGVLADAGNPLCSSGCKPFNSVRYK